VYASWNSAIAAITFYTCLPIPSSWVLDFSRIARWAPLVGIGLGTWLMGIDGGLGLLGMPLWTRSSAIVLLWLWSTGGLHLDGAMDAADGLAVQQPERRLTVMADSVAGAFGVMAAVAILAVKICALGELGDDRGWALIFAAGWSRWGQVWAIAFYPYLKAEGKGSFHKQGLRLPQDLILGAIALIGAAVVYYYYQPALLTKIAIHSLICMVTSLAVGYYFQHRFGGQTGDTYGAIVEWSEAIILCTWMLV
jgi:adenosylcobinamide-GDP ribazoletransferase